MRTIRDSRYFAGIRTSSRRCVAIVVSAVAIGCGGGTSPTATTPVATEPTGPTTVEFTGSTRQTSPTGCSGDTHAITVASGAVTVTLTETSDPAAAMSLQVCANGIDSGTCTISQQKIARGQTLSGERLGAASQQIKLLPYACVFSGTFSTTPVTYKITVGYTR